ncbi:hypothetical protein LSAT2_032864 [Lamellibrachia satsuma]|nr:hypothetical protein LSAT2_032864 [Lamellibrachia satsuma]
MRWLRCYNWRERQNSEFTSFLRRKERSSCHGRTLSSRVSRCHGEVPVTFAPHHSEWEGCGEGDGRGPTGGGGGEGP